MLLASVSVAIAGWIALDSLVAMIDGHVAAPFWDGWGSVVEYRMWLEQRFGVAQLFGQHNEHRIAAGRVFFLADYMLFGGRGVFLSACIAAILAATAGLLIWAARPDGAAGWTRYAVAASAVVGCCLNLAASENLLWSFQVPFVLLYLSAAGALYATMRASVAARSGGKWGGWLAAAVATAVVSAFSMANGLAAAGLSVVLALALRANWRIPGLLTAVFVGLTAAYFHGYVSSTPSGGLGYLAAEPTALPTYLFMFLGNIVRDFPARETTTAVLGAFGFLLCLCIAWRIGVRRDLNPVRLFLTGFILFILAAGVASGAGRIEQFGLNQALAPRYVTPGAMFWAAQVLYWFSAARSSPNRRMHALPTAATAVLLVILAAAQHSARIDAGGLMASMVRQGDAALVGVHDQATAAASTPLTGDLARDLAFLRSRRKAMFAEPQAHWMGRPFAKLAKLDGRCIAVIDRAAPTPDDPRGLHLAGWAWDNAKHRRVNKLVIVNDAGEVVGLASGGYARPDVPKAEHRVDHAASGWQGFALGKPGQTFGVYGMLAGGHACRVGETVATPS
jgi:hypothetical protein